MPRLSFPDAETEIPNTPSMYEGIQLESETWQAVRRYKLWFEREAGMKLWRNLGLGLAAIAAIIWYVPLASAQQQPQPLKVTKIKKNVYWIQGGVGSNDGVIVGTNGVIVVDTKTTTDSETGVIAEIAKITPKAVNTAIITHSDGDHVNGLAAFPDGLTIIAQENCKKEMEASVNTKQPAPQNRLPNKTVGDKENLTINGVKFNLLHFAPAHTSGDLMI